jgi:hypothetical protein
MPAIVTAAVANDFKNGQIRRFDAVFAIEGLLGIVTSRFLTLDHSGVARTIVRQNRGAWGEGCTSGYCLSSRWYRTTNVVATSAAF